MNWSSMVIGVAMGCGGFVQAQPAPPEVKFIAGPAGGAFKGSITTAIYYKNAPGAAKVEITIYRSARCLGLLVPVPLDSDTQDVTLPEGGCSVNFFDGLPTGCPVTYALVEVKDAAGNVIARKWLVGLQVIVP